MAEKPIKTPLPADLPEDWNAGQVVAPTGEEVGLSHQHGYNYLMEQVNAAQRAFNFIDEAFGGIDDFDILTNLSRTEPANLNGSNKLRPGVTGVLPIQSGGTGVSSLEDLKALVGSGDLGRYILTGTYTGHVAGGGTAKIYFKPDKETSPSAALYAVQAKYGALVLCSILLDAEESQTAEIGLNKSNNTFSLWISTSFSGKKTQKIPFRASKLFGDEIGSAYFTLGQTGVQQIGGEWLELRSTKGTGFNYKVEMLFLMPDIDVMGTGSGGSPGTPGETGHGIPSGGTTGQFLAKRSAADYDAGWVDPPGGDGSGGVAGVSAFNGRTGAVSPQNGDYTADMVGAIPAGQVKAILSVTQAQYDALTAKDAATLYIIKE